MPALIPYIHDIAIEKERAVLLITFEFSDGCNYRNSPIRENLIKWLEQQKIEYQPATVQEYSYLGELYVDVPFDPNNSMYKVLVEHLENEDGSPKVEGVYFHYLPLEHALTMREQYSEHYE